jgi:hypothetical protein
MKSWAAILILVFAFSFGLARAEDIPKYRVICSDGRIFYITSVVPVGLDSLAFSLVEGGTVTLERNSVVNLERRKPIWPSSKLLGATNFFLELRPGYFLPQNDIKDFKKGISYGGSLGYSAEGHTVEASFDYFFRAAQENANNLDTLRLAIAAVHYVYSIEIARGFNINIGAGPSMVFFSRRGKFTGYGKGEKFSASLLGGFSLGPLYVYGRYLLPFTHDDPAQLPKSSIKYGGIVAQGGIRF